MCKYCEIGSRQSAFLAGDVDRGELMADDCDIDIYIDFYKNEYYLTAECIRWGRASSDPIMFCPFCGRELTKYVK